MVNTLHPVPEFSCFEIPIDYQPKLLVWHGGELIDPVAGNRYSPQKGIQQLTKGAITLGGGDIVPLGFIIGFSFDSGHSLSVDGHDWMVVYQRNGTKGLILRDLENVREINRSYYHAQSYEYPVKLIRLPSGRAGLIHCPVDYNILHIEDAETGECLTSRGGQEASDVFHSRLDTMPDGSGFCDHGWIWHPVEDAAYFSVDACLASPALLDQFHKYTICDSSYYDQYGESREIENAVCCAGGTVVCTWKEYYGNEGGSSFLRSWSSTTKTWISDFIETEALGVLYCGDKYAYSLFDHLKLLEIASGKVLKRWPHIKSGNQRSVITRGTSVPVAFDPISFSIAVATETAVCIVQPESARPEPQRPE